MGNRAVVVFHNPASKEISPAVYVHYNGGPESIYSFLDEMDRRRIRPTTLDIECEVAQFVHLIGDFFDQDAVIGLSLRILTNRATKITPKGLMPVNSGDDNGVYVVTRGLPDGRLVRRFVNDRENLREMSADEVEDERVAAYNHAYIVGPNTIAKDFARIQPTISGVL